MSFKVWSFWFDRLGGRKRKGFNEGKKKEERNYHFSSIFFDVFGLKYKRKMIDHFLFLHFLTSFLRKSFVKGFSIGRLVKSVFYFNPCSFNPHTPNFQYVCSGAV